MLAIMSRSGATTLRISMRRALHVEQLAELRLGRRLEDLVLQRVDLVVELGEDGEEAVHQRAR